MARTAGTCLGKPRGPVAPPARAQACRDLHVRGLLCDCALAVGEEELPAHKALLAIASPVRPGPGSRGRRPGARRPYGPPAGREGR